MAIKKGDIVYAKLERGAVRNAFRTAYQKRCGERATARRFDGGYYEISVKATKLEVLATLPGGKLKVHARKGLWDVGTKFTVSKSDVETR